MTDPASASRRTQHRSSSPAPTLDPADEARLREIDRALEAARADVERRLSDARRTDGGTGQDAMDRDIAVHRLVSRQTVLRRFTRDLCLGKVVPADGGEELYVGRTGLVSPEGKRLLVDWRAPAAEPFFGATHEDPMGLAMRRRFLWQLGHVVDFWDEVFDPQLPTDSRALDEHSAFIRSLGGSRSPRMRDVLGTIQADQDRIIRAGSRDALVVDGGPGTGKTVAALHRAAYLLYADARVSRTGGGVLFLGPNDRYLSYVDDVLPSLGEDSVRIATLRRLVAEGDGASVEADPRVAAIKGRTEWEHTIATIVREYERVPDEPTVVATSWADIDIEPDEWAEALEAADDGTPHNEARDAVWNQLLDLVTAKVTEMPPHLARRELEHHSGLRETFDRVWPMLSPAGLVAALWTSPPLIARHAAWLSDDDAERIRRTDGTAWTLADLPLLDAARDLIGDPAATERRLAHARALTAERERIETVVEYLHDADEDGEGTSLMLDASDMQERLIDPGALPTLPTDALAGPFAHVIVDEAQELSPAEWRMLIRRCPSKSFTIVGDRAQARYGFTETWQERLTSLGIARSTVAELTINYRTPAEIMAEAAPVIRTARPDANVPTSVRETGRPVQHARVGDLATILERWLGEHDEGVACVIGSADVPPLPRVTALTPPEAKGLEFDLVVLVDPDSFGDGVTGAVDRYVAMTRATSDLVILTS